MKPIFECNLCFYSENKATYIHTKENRSYLLDHSLEHWNGHLDPVLFFRVNRTFIVHVNAKKTSYPTQTAV